MMLLTDGATTPGNHVLMAANTLSGMGGVITHD